MEHKRHLPAEALFVNGIALEELFMGYQTLGVTGREFFAKEITPAPNSVVDGSKIIGTRYPDRNITVNYALRARNNREFREFYQTVNKMFSHDKLELVFNDDVDYSFYGTFSEAEEVEAGRNIVTGSFTFYCDKPFKYGRETSNVGREVMFFTDTHLPPMPTKIIVHLKQNSREVTLLNGTKQIRLSGRQFTKGQVFEFDFINSTITENKQSMLPFLDLSSRFEDFQIIGEEPIRLKEVGELEVFYREVAL